MSSDYEVLRQHHKFVRNDEEDEILGAKSWGSRMARKYYNNLYKEFALVDLSRYKSEQVGLRWRTEKEVLGGKGLDICGEVNCCRNCNLKQVEIPFAYREDNVSKLELVKVTVCSYCFPKLAIKNAGIDETDRSRNQENKRRKVIASSSAV